MPRITKLGLALVSRPARRLARLSPTARDSRSVATLGRVGVAAVLLTALAAQPARAQGAPVEVEEPARTQFAVGMYLGSYSGIPVGTSGLDYSIGGVGGWATFYVPVQRVGFFWRPAVGAYYTFTAEQSGFTTHQYGGEVGTRLFRLPVYRTAEPFVRLGVGALHLEQKQPSEPGAPLASYTDWTLSPGAGVTFSSFFNPGRVAFRGQLNDLIILGRDGRETSHHFAIEGGAMFRF